VRGYSYLPDFSNRTGSQEAKIAVFGQNDPRAPVFLADSDGFDALNILDPGQKAEFAVRFAPPVLIGA